MILDACTMRILVKPNSCMYCKIKKESYIVLQLQNIN